MFVFNKKILSAYKYEVKELKMNLFHIRMHLVLKKKNWQFSACTSCTLVFHSALCSLPNLPQET